MKERHKRYLKLNIMSLFFISVSFISITLAWFAYSGIASTKTEIDVKSWLVEFKKGENKISNDIAIAVTDIYPGMETFHESIKIFNQGDSDAQLSYNITSVRIFDDEISGLENTNEKLIDHLSHDYPFKINASVSDNYIEHGGGESQFDVSVSWPLDSGDDINDSIWGNKAYEFQKNEAIASAEDANYSERPSIKILISVKAEQLIEDNDNSPDLKYHLGNTILINKNNGNKCEALSTECIKTYVLDVNNKIGDEKVTLLPDLFNTYESGNFGSYNTMYESVVSSWKIKTRKLLLEDLLKVVSRDVFDTKIIRENLSTQVISNVILGDVNNTDKVEKNNVIYDNRVEYLITQTTPYNGYISFKNEKQNFITSNKCYWINKEYDTTRGFALTKIDDSKSQIYGEVKNTSCSVVPVIIADKDILEGITE